jgi:hypothetical protein
VGAGGIAGAQGRRTIDDRAILDEIGIALKGRGMGG